VTIWRAFLIVVLPGYGLWLLARDNPMGHEKGRAFSRRPDLSDLALFLLAVFILAGGLVADSRFVLFIGAFFSVAAVYRLALRLFSPASWFQTDWEFRAAANLRSLTRVAFYGFLIWLVATQRWASAELFAALITSLIVIETLIVLSAFAIGRRIFRRKQHAKS